MRSTRARLSVFLSMATLLASPVSFAAVPKAHLAPRKQVTLKLKLEIDGVKMEEKGLTLPFGRSGAIGKVEKKSTGDGTFVEVTPSERADGTIEIRFLLGRITQGKRTLSSGPTLVTRRGKTTTYVADGKPDADFRHLRFRVTPY